MCVYARLCVAGMYGVGVNVSVCELEGVALPRRGCGGPWRAVHAASVLTGQAVSGPTVSSGGGEGSLSVREGWTERLSRWRGGSSPAGLRDSPTSPQGPPTCGRIIHLRTWPAKKGGVMI